MSVEQIYDFEGIIEAATKAVLVNAGIENTFTSAGDSELQRIRPRVEVLFALGGGQQRWQIVDGNSYTDRREVAWKGTLKLEVVTDSKYKVHAAYRAMVRNIMATFAKAVNATAPMTRHKIQLVIDAGASPILKPEEGYFQTALLYEVDFSIQANAWDALKTT